MNDPTRFITNVLADPTGTTYYLKVLDTNTTKLHGFIIDQRGIIIREGTLKNGVGRTLVADKKTLPAPVIATVKKLLDQLDREE